MLIRRFHHRLAAVGLMVGILLVPLLATAAPAHASLVDTSRLEHRMVLLVNQARASADLPALVVHADLRDVATEWSRSMAADEELAHNPDFAAQILGWKRISENVGRTVRDDGRSLDAAADRLHAAFMGSPSHRANVMSRHATEIGIGAVVSGGHVWVTENLREPISAGAATVALVDRGATGPHGSMAGGSAGSTSALGIAATRGGWVGLPTLVSALLGGVLLAVAARSQLSSRSATRSVNQIGSKGFVT